MDAQGGRRVQVLYFLLVATAPPPHMYGRPSPSARKDYQYWRYSRAAQRPVGEPRMLLPPRGGRLLSSPTLPCTRERLGFRVWSCTMGIEVATYIRPKYDSMYGVRRRRYLVRV